MDQLIVNAQVEGRQTDVRLQSGHIVALAPALPRFPGLPCVDAQGAALLPGLHDHHLHLHATAAAMASVACGPPQVMDAETLARALRTAAGQGEGWMRGTGYHESVAGQLDRTSLDAWVSHRPLRIQHRSGRLWILNSAALALVEAAAGGTDDALERIGGRATGRVYDADTWLRARVGGRWPDLQALSEQLVARGITGCTDTGHANDGATLAELDAAAEHGRFAPHLHVMGSAALDAARPRRARVAATKFHLHDHALPDFDTVCRAVRRSHESGRSAAFHCVTRAELVFALAVLHAVGSRGRDRIEHAGIAPDESLDALRRLGLRVVTQPHFVAERGDQYRADVPADEHALLYRLRSLLVAGVPLAAGSDAPYGDPDPWRAMQAAVTRRTASGAVLGADEALNPEQALALFMAPLEDPGLPARRLTVGAPADLCLLDRPWEQARRDLSAVRVVATWIAGVRYHDGRRAL